MSDHGRGHGSQILQCLRVVKLYHPVDGGAGGSDEVLVLAGLQQAGVFLRDRLCAHGGFLDEAEADFAQGGDDLLGVVGGESRNERGGEAGYHAPFFPVGEQSFHGAELAVHLLCVLRADEGALAAEYAALLDDFRLVIFVANCFDGALAQALEAVLALCVLEVKVWRGGHIPSLLYG